jgi:HEPN domain-containing protein
VSLKFVKSAGANKDGDSFSCVRATLALQYPLQMTTTTKQGATAATHPHGIQVIQWLAWADEDYLAARSLLLRAFVLQGSMLANTSIEKYIKAALVARGVTFRNTHDVAALYESLKSSGTVTAVNASFLKTLGKVYKLRYPDDLPTGFNIALAQVKVLAEMDATVHALRKGFTFQRTDGHTVTTKLDALLADNSASLTERNAAFGSCTRADVFASPTHCYELRVLDDGNILEAKYEAGPIPDDGIFDAVGIKPT